MRLLFYSPQFLPSVGGLQNMVHYWALGLATRDHDIVVICSTHGNDDETLPYRVYRSPSFGQTVSLMREAELVMMFNVSLKALPQLLLSRTSLVVSHHSAYRYPGKPASWQQKLKRIVANRFAVGNIACSSYIASDYRNCTVIPNTYASEIFYDQQLQRLPGSILFVGRLVTDKGIDMLLNAIKIVKSSSDRISKLTIVGIGPEETSIREEAKAAPYIDLKGGRDSKGVATLMNQHEILVVPSRLEPFGIVVLEGLACGCEVIVSNAGGLKEAGGGLVHSFESESVNELASGLLEALNGPAINIPEKRQAHLDQFSKRNSALKLEHFLMEKQALISVS